jgi:signal transduction histidine kinase
MPELRATPEPLPRSAGWAVFGVLTVFVAAGTARLVPDRPVLAGIGAVVALGFGALAILGRRSPILVAVAAGSAGIALLGNGTASNVVWFGLPVFAAWCALSASLLGTALYWAGATLLLLGEAAFTSHDPGWAAWIGGTCFSVVGCTFARRQRDLVAQLREAQAGLAGRAQAEERNRIARELHDVIAHSLTVSLLHVSSARLALDEDRDEAVRALDEAERLGRQSLDEVRHAVGLLHREGESDPTAPLPGSLDVPVLLERFRSAGADVRSTLHGDLHSLPNTVGLATYRILQEALTNAVKHAPDATSTVRLDVQPDAVRLTVDSSGVPRRGTGLGLAGMRERAESLGGRFEAGPGGNGWLVRAELPLAPAS